MIKRLITVVLFSALAAIQAAAQAQPNRFPPINLIAGDLTGTPCQPNSLAQSSTSGVLYTCQGGAYRMPGGTTIPPTMVTWPPSCSNGTYVPATNTCVPTGTAANPGGSAGQTQINAGGSTFVGIPGSMTDAVNGWKTQGGMQYAKGWQSGGGNNGIGNAAALNSTVIADPSYATTEYFTQGTTGHAWAMGVDQAHTHDVRNGQVTDTYTSPFQTPFDGSNSAQTIHLYSTLVPAANTNFGRFKALNIRWDSLASGIDNGDQTAGQHSWTTGSAIEINGTSATPGIFSPFNIFHFRTGVGDTANYFYNTSYGGAVASNDEGNHALGYKANEAASTFTGTVVTGGGGLAAATVKTSCLTDCSIVGLITVGAGPGDGRFLLDRQNVIDSGNIISATNPTNALPGNMAIDHSITPSIATGTLTADCNPGFEPYPYGVSYNTVTCTVSLAGGSGPFVAGSSLVCFGGIRHEQALITSVTGSGPYTLGMRLRHAHKNGDWIGQGGPCGQYINLTANDQGSAPTLHYPLELLGAPDATHLYYGFFFTGNSGQSSAGLGNLFLQTFTLVSIANTGGTVTFLVNGLGLSTVTPFFYNASTVQFAGTTSGAFDGPCTNAKYDIATNTASCTQASSIGAPNGGAVGTATVGTSRYGNAGYVTWYGAETLDVLDHSQSPPAVFTGGAAGTGVGATSVFTLEPNIGTWADGGAVEQAHHYAQRMNGFYGGSGISNPMTSTTNAASIAFSGGGAAGGIDTNANSMSILQLANNSGSSQYVDHGGFRTPPGGISLTNAGVGNGLFKWGLNMQNAPDPHGSSVLYVGCPLTGCTDPNYSYNLATLSGQGAGNNGVFQYHPQSNAWFISGNVNFNTPNFGNTTYVDNVSFAPLPATGFTATAVASGGTLADSTQFCYVMKAGNNAGTGTWATEKCATTGVSGGHNSVRLNWNRVQGAVHYYFYGRTTLNEKFCNSIDNVPLATQWIDNNSLACTTGGAQTSPGPDTSRGGVDQAAFVGLNSAGTAFELKLQAPASMAATSTITITKIVPASITPAAVTASTCAEQTFATYTGLATGQVVNVSPPASLGANVWIGWTRVSAANTLAIGFCSNATGGTPPAGVYLAMAF